LCKQRIDAVEKALEQSLGNARIESEPTEKSQRSVPSASAGFADMDDDVPF